MFLPHAISCVCYSERCEKTYKDLENKQESLAEKLSKLQQDYQQAMMKVTGVAPTSNR